MGKGDNFYKVSRRAEQYDPSADKWGDQVLYLLRILTGSDLPTDKQIVVKIDGDLPAVVAKINEAIAKLNELKSELIDIDSNTDTLETQLDTINSSVNTQGTDITTSVETGFQNLIETFLDRLENPVEVTVTNSAMFYRVLIPITSNGQTSFTLPVVIANPTTTLLFLEGAKAVYVDDYTISGTTLTWAGVALETTDTLEIYYWA